MSDSSSPTMVLSDRNGPRSLILQKSRLAILSGEREGEAIVVDRPVFSLGAGSGNDLVLPDRFLSRNHCEIENSEAGYILRDLDSTNGTYLQGIRIREAFLPRGAEIRIGNTRLSFNPLPETRQFELSRSNHFGNVIGNSVPMRRIFHVLETFAPSDTSILIEGETGTGKEVLAEAIHANSRRSKQPFIVIDCGALSNNLVESELFGHTRGAFTGATSDRIGAFEQADGGTVFLDEIGELSAEIQPKLLRVLEKREVRRLGTNLFHRINVRILSATNRRLESAVNNGKFREDLFYRLAMMKVEMPPLRKRREDISVLIDHFINECDTVTDHEALKQKFSSGMIRDYIERHAWPGNVRELKNFVNMIALSGPEVAGITCATVGDRGQPDVHAGGSNGLVVDIKRPFKDAKADLIKEFESRYIIALLEQHHWNISRAARSAGIERAYLQRLARKYSLTRPGAEIDGEDNDLETTP